MRSLRYLLFAFVICLVTLCNANAEVCTYRYDNYTYECDVTTSSLSCDFEYGSNLNRNAINTSNLNMTLSENDFINSAGEVDCNEVRNLYFDQNVNNLSVQILYDIRSDNNNCPIHTERYNARPSDFMPGTYSTGCITYSLTSSNNNDNNGTNTGNGGGFNEGSGAGTGQEDSSNNGEFNTENFCEGSVQGVFTTIGWVFFIAKILIPIVLIIFGSIDFGKAMLSNKDDEIKKSAKSLVMRAVAGVIIFFVPTLLNFVVELIGGDDLYNGTFATCTHCMLEPTDSNCRKLIGD